MADTRYNNREIDQKLEAFKETSDANRVAILETITRNDKDYRESLTRIEVQTTQHNHRMSKLESWQAYVVGFCGCLSLFVLPILLMAAKAFFHV